MTRTMIGVILALTLAALVMVGTSLVQGEEEKVTLCHKAPGQNPVTITVAQPAVPSHQQHGDTLGPCPATPAR